jgi:tetratricopeptide (TPR) repeat protein
MGIFDSKEEGKPLKKYLEQLWEYQEAEADLLVEIATIYYENDDSPEAVNYLEKAAEVYKELGYNKQEASLLDLIGDLYYGMNDNENASDYYRQSYKIYSSESDPTQEEVLNKLKKLDVSSESSGDATVEKTFPPIPKVESGPSFSRVSLDDVEIVERLDDIIMLLNEASVYESYKNFKNPMEHVREAYDMSSSIGDEKGQAALLVIMGNIFLKDHNSNNALDSFEKALKIYRRIDDKKGQAIALLLIGASYYILGASDQTSTYLNEAISILKDTEDLDTEIKANNLFKALSK